MDKQLAATSRWQARAIAQTLKATGASATQRGHAAADRRALLLSLVTAMLGSGCASVATQGPGAPRSAADQRAAVPESLTVERQWLQSWFQGTPVLIAQDASGAVMVEVPREFCFDRGRSTIKPALGAVLDKVAQSLRRQPLARLSLLAAPDDATGASPLALQRAAQLHKHLLSRAVPAAHLAPPSATASAMVQLRMEAAQP